MTLLPAVDVAGGRAAQVVGEGTTDPYAVARAWVDQGARWVHLVDLDRAFARGDNLAQLAEIIDALPVPVQLSGGIGDDAALTAALGTRAHRIVLTSAALRDPGWVGDAVRAHPNRIAVGIDVHGAEVVARGTEARLGPLDDVLAGLAAVHCRTFVVADAARDGRRHGADTALFRRVAEEVDGTVIASGGVASLADLKRLVTLVPAGVSGVVLGAALYHGAFTMAEALETAGATP